MSNIQPLSSSLEKASKATLNIAHVGDFDVIRNNEHSFSVKYLKTSEIIVDNLYLFSAAMAIALSLKDHDIELARNYIQLENIYVKHVTKMRFYKNSNKWDLYENELMEAKSILNIFHSKMAL